MAKPIVAVVGRPNVGKSTFFNKMVGKRISIVEDRPGVTRDRIYADVEWVGNHFTLIDTGGIEMKSDDLITNQIKVQAEIAIEMADVIVFMVDGKASITTSDEEISNLLRRSKKPIVLVANKIDNMQLPDSYYDFYTLGLDSPVPISSVNGLNLGDLLDVIVSKLPKQDEIEEDDTIKVAFIGKPNVGKSSLINRILGEDRVIVSNIAGTTRDAIDTPFTLDEDKYVFIDTAGIRRKSKVYESVEKYSVIRSLTAIERSDVCLIVIDAEQGITEQDKRIAGYAHEAGKAAVIIINKWDLLKKNNHTFNSFTKTVREELAYMTYAPILFLSAKTGQRVDKILEYVKYVANQASMRISTGALNDLVGEATLLNQPPSDKGKRLKIYYASQVAIKPPRFVLFVNDYELAHFSYVRYIENQIRQNYNFEGTPIVMEVKERKKKKFK